MLTIIVSGGLYPLHVHASAISSFTDKVKAIFVGEKASDSPALATSQTMELFKPVVIDESSALSAEVPENNDQESLQAVSGPLRVSTEDIDFPTTDTVSVYEVKKGDTIQDVAKLFNVSVNTIVWANDLKSRTISKGDTLIILPMTGIKHTVKKGDTVMTIAKKYKADPDDIAKYNGLMVDSQLTLGDTLLVPEGEIVIIQPTKITKSTKIVRTTVLNRYANIAPLGELIRPIIGGRKTQGIHGHNGIDLGAAPGTPVLASGAGQVIVAKAGGYNGGYGDMIVISHEGGIQTVYAHLRAVYVNPGQTVSQGQQIGELGNTGRSTGPHLHFEVRGAKNPF